MAIPTEKLATEVVDLNTERDAIAHRERQKVRLWQIVGATKLANRLVESLGAQAVHAIEQVRDQKLYIPAGYETIRDFLDRDPESPMSYDQFNRRTKLLESEGDVIFDLLNSLNVPLKDRKMLAGQIEIDGNEIRIGDTCVRKDDEAAILNLITTQHAKLLEQQRTNDRLTKKIKKGEEDFEKLKRSRRCAKRFSSCCA